MPEGDFKPICLEIEKWVWLRIGEWSVLICLWSPRETVNNTWLKAEHTHSHLYTAKHTCLSLSFLLMYWLNVFFLVINMPFLFFWQWLTVIFCAYTLMQKSIFLLSFCSHTLMCNMCMCVCVCIFPVTVCVCVYVMQTGSISSFRRPPSPPLFRKWTNGIWEDGESGKEREGGGTEFLPVWFVVCRSCCTTGGLETQR